MASLSELPRGVHRALGGRGKKLHTHEIHIRRTANKGYIARHEMRDRNGQPPTDGQSSELEYSLPDKAAMLAHVEQSMGDQQPQPDEDQEPDEPQDASQV